MHRTRAQCTCRGQCYDPHCRDPIHSPFPPAPHCRCITLPFRMLRPDGQLSPAIGLHFVTCHLASDKSGKETKLWHEFHQSHTLVLLLQASPSFTCETAMPTPCWSTWSLLCLKMLLYATRQWDSRALLLLLLLTLVCMGVTQYSCLALMR